MAVLSFFFKKIFFLWTYKYLLGPAVPNIIRVPDNSFDFSSVEIGADAIEDLGSNVDQMEAGIGESIKIPKCFFNFHNTYSNVECMGAIEAGAHGM